MNCSKHKILRFSTRILSISQNRIAPPSYLWSSADVGDAHLVDTEPSETLEEAISALKAKIVELLAAFS
ncbi:MAG: hypothetical protein ICV54_08875 [Nostoc sp. C3-bin3]|nr:hypothetical protein [Nostoc sp. C3-bin3]